MNDFMTKWLKMSLVAIVGCGFLAMIVYALMMRDDIKSAQVEPPLVAAPDEALKRRPDEPGGMVIPHQDKQVFDLLDGPSATQQIAVAEPAPAATDTPAPEAPAATPPAAPVAEETVTPPVAIAAVQPAQPAAPMVKEEPKPEPKVEPKPAAKPEPVKVAASSGGAYGVQLGASSTESGAEKAVATFGKNAALAGLTGKVVKASVGGKTVYRIQFVGAPTRDAAAKICTKLTPCMVVGK